MSISKKTTQTKNLTHHAESTNLEFEADVLFQRLYGKWYAFSIVEEDCFVTEVTDDEVNRRLAKRPTPKAS